MVFDKTLQLLAYSLRCVRRDELLHPWVAALPFITHESSHVPSAFAQDHRKRRAIFESIGVAEHAQPAEGFTDLGDSGRACKGNPAPRRMRDIPDARTGPVTPNPP